MASRPLGMYLLCGFFAFFGFGLLVTAGSVPSAPNQPPSVDLFLTIAPVYFVVLGVLGFVAAIALWIAHPLGRTAGLVWIGLWIVEEALMGIWGEVGPAVIREASGGYLDSIGRILVAAVMVYYLWTVGDEYIE